MIKYHLAFPIYLHITQIIHVVESEGTGGRKEGGLSLACVESLQKPSEQSVHGTKFPSMVVLFDKI